MSINMVDEATDQGVVARAQKRANKESATMYVGLTFSMNYYVSKKKPTPDWLIATVEPDQAAK
jgi:hypothetical protein